MVWYVSFALSVEMRRYQLSVFKEATTALTQKIIYRRGYEGNMMKHSWRIFGDLFSTKCKKI
jgi:hypothetical protein